MSIGKKSFALCPNLTHVAIPDTVVSIEAEAFKDCDNLTIYCEASSKPSGWSEAPLGEWHGGNNVVWSYEGD